jgi:hypothetical protein
MGLACIVTQHALAHAQVQLQQMTKHQMAKQLKLTFECNDCIVPDVKPLRDKRQLKVDDKFASVITHNVLLITYYS